MRDGFLTIETNVLYGDVDTAGGSAELGDGTLARGLGTCSHPFGPGPEEVKVLERYSHPSPRQC